MARAGSVSRCAAHGIEPFPRRRLASEALKVKVRLLKTVRQRGT